MGDEKMKKFGINVLVILTIITLCIASAQAAQISIEPAYQDVFNGDTITVDIMVYPEVSDVYGASYTIYFNNTLLNAISQTQGPFLTQDTQSSIVWGNVIDNPNGKIEYSESRMGIDFGVTDPGVLTTITFNVIGEEGVSSLNISDYNGELLYSTFGPVLADINNGSVKIAKPSSPFLVNGYIRYENSSKCNNSEIIITNLDTSKEWPAKTIESSNYYNIMLASCVDVIAGETLQFNVFSPDGSQWNITEHIVTEDEVDVGGFEYNITLDIHDVFIKSDYTGAYGTGIRIDNVTTEGISLDQNLTIGDTYFIKYMVLNNGTVIETVDIIVEVSNGTWSEELANYQWDVNNHHNGNVTWNTAGLAPGNYNIKVNASIPMDCNPDDNERTRNVALELPDNTPPTVTDNTPTGTDVPVTTAITVTFNESMNASSVEGAFSIDPSVTGTFEWSGDTVTFTPDADLSYSETYDVTITTGAEDLAGDPMSEAYTWEFTTGQGSEPDNTAPVVSITKPKKDSIKFFNNIVRGKVDDDNLNYATLTVRDNNDTVVNSYNLTIKSNKFTQRVQFAPNQNNTLELFAIDYAGNSNNASKTVYVETNIIQENKSVKKRICLAR